MGYIFAVVATNAAAAVSAYLAKKIILNANVELAWLKCCACMRVWVWVESAVGINSYLCTYMGKFDFFSMAQLVFTSAHSFSLFFCTHLYIFMWVSVVWLQTYRYEYIHLFCTMTQAKMKFLYEIASGNSKAYTHSITYFRERI